MTIKNSGSQLSFSEIEAEFGQPDNGRSLGRYRSCLLYTSPSPRDLMRSRMPSSA